MEPDRAAPAWIASFREDDDAGRTQTMFHARANRAVEIAHRVEHGIWDRQSGIAAVGEHASERGLIYRRKILLYRVHLDFRHPEFVRQRQKIGLVEDPF